MNEEQPPNAQVDPEGERPDAARTEPKQQPTARQNEPRSQTAADRKAASGFYRVKFRHSSETEVCRSDAIELVAGQAVIAPSKYGKDLGIVLGTVASVEEIQAEEPVAVARIASEQDLALHERNKKREREAIDICAEKIVARGLEMKLISAHFLPEESKVLFFFTADGRVDFRELVKDLVAVFRMRIELRQVGVRDESRMLGGVAVCGRMYCCHGVTDHLRPVSIKMAKEQNLSLNSMKISGPCGRLLCCLSYEYDFYREEKRRFPAEESIVYSGSELFKVMEVNIISRKVVLESREGGVQEVPYSSLSYDSASNRWKAHIVSEVEDGALDSGPDPSEIQITPGSPRSS